MSRSPSVVSTVESVDDDPLMKDCYELRRRLILTEKSLKNLNPQTSAKDVEDAVSEKSRSKEYIGASPDSIPLLTLDDLTPVSSSIDKNRASEDLFSSGRSFSFPDINRQIMGDSTQGYNQENRSGAKNISNLTDLSNSNSSSLRTKLLNVRDENSRLFAQNNLIVTQLEDTTYQLSETQAKLRMKESLLKEQRIEKSKQTDHITFLEQEIMENELQIRNFTKNEEFMKKKIHFKEEELNKLKSTLREIEDDYTEELRIRKSFEAKLEESLLAGEKMKQKLVEVRNQMQTEIKSYDDSEKGLKQSLKECEQDRANLIDKITELEETLIQTENKFRKETEALKSTLNMERNLVNDLEENLRSFETKEQENEDLKRLINEKEEKIQDYQNEVEGAKNQMFRLEALVQQVQENALKSQIMNTPLTSDSGISNVASQSTPMVNASPTFHGRYPSAHYENGEDSLECSPSRSKAIMADFEMKLAKKDVEIQKLQAALTARSAAHQRSFAGLDDVTAGSMNGLRSELTAVVERSRMGDKKQNDLERIITRLEDDLANYSNQIMVLEERLTDKMAQISSLEGKVSQKNLKLSTMQNEIGRNTERVSEAENELHKRDIKIKNLENDLQSHKLKIAESAGQVKNFEKVVEEKIKHITELEGLSHLKETEKNQATSLVNKVKSLHSEQCQEFEKQIELFEQRLEEKTLQLTNLESNFIAANRELEMKTSICQDLQEELDKSRSSLEERSLVLLQHESKLKTLQDQMVKETAQVGNLEQSLSNCKKELNIILEQTELSKEDSKAEFISQRSEFQKLNELFTKAKEELHEKTNALINLRDSLKQREEMLMESQKRITELEEYQEQLERDQTKYRNQSIVEKKKIEEEFFVLKENLEISSKAIENQTKQVVELESALKESHAEVKLRAQKVNELEKSLQESIADANNGARHIEALQGEIKSSNARFEELLEKNRQTEVKLLDANKRSHDATRKAADLDKEVSAVQTELKQTMTDLSMLQNVLSKNQKEINKKEEQVSELDRMLNQSQEDIQQKQLELEEQNLKLTLMDEVMKEHKLELRQKAVAVTQLDMTFKEQQSELLHKLNTAELHLSKTVEELNQRTVENAELRAKLDLLRDKMDEKSSEIDELKNLVQKQKSQLKEKIAKLSEADEEIDKLRRKEEEFLHTQQELRLVRENEQQVSEELQSVRRDLMKYERNEAELARELDDCHELLKSKEADCTRLARDLGASQVREAQGEARSIQELQKITQQLQFKIKQTEQEAEKTQEKQAKKLISQEQELTKLKLAIQSDKDEKILMENDLQRSQQRISEQEEDLSSLSRQLQLQQQQAKELSEHSLIKEAEITRLEARISGYERATFGFRSSRGSRPSTPVSYTPRRDSPPPQRPVSATPQIGHGRMTPRKREQTESHHALVPNLHSSWKTPFSPPSNNVDVTDSSFLIHPQERHRFEVPSSFTDVSDFEDLLRSGNKQFRPSSSRDHTLDNTTTRLSFN